MVFNEPLYLEEMKSLIDKAIERLDIEKTNFKIYTASIWTDPNSVMSSINFDSKYNSISNVEESNQWNKKYYDQYLEEGELEQAELFKPNFGTRVCNPADFELRDFEKIIHHSFPENWENDTDGKCWVELEPALVKTGNYAFAKIKELNVENGFELSINSSEDWYDKTWS